MQINGEQISDAELEELTDKIRPFADSMTDVPTEFELITALAMEYFAKNEADIVVLEVGLGGALDSLKLTVYSRVEKTVLIFCRLLPLQVSALQFSCT